MLRAAPEVRLSSISLPTLARSSPLSIPSEKHSAGSSLSPSSYEKDMTVFDRLCLEVLTVALRYVVDVARLM